MDLGDLRVVGVLILAVAPILFIDAGFALVGCQLSRPGQVIIAGTIIGFVATFSLIVRGIEVVCTMITVRVESAGSP